MNVLGMIKNENLVALKKWQYTENDWKHPQAHSVHIAGRRLSYGSSDVRSQNSGNQRAHSLRHVHGCFYSKCERQGFTKLATIDDFQAQDE